MEFRKVIVARYAVVFIGILLFSIAIISKIVLIQVSAGERWSKKIADLQNQTEVVKGNRGNIYSADGKVLATSVPYYQIRFDLVAPGVREVFWEEVDALSDSLSQMFPDKSKARFKADLLKAYKNNNRYYLVYRNKINYLQLQRIKTFPIFNRGKFAGGFIAVQDNKRFLPHGDMASRMLGRLNKGAYGGDHGTVGISGIEGSYEGFLSGGEGINVKQNLSGQWVSMTSVEPDDGNDVVTTLDSYWQDVVEDALFKQVEKSKAEYGTAVLMEVQTGKIRAIANLGKLASGGYSETYNYAIGNQGSKAPGSTFKLVSLMFALEEGKVDTSDVYDLGDGSLKVYDQKIYDSDYGYKVHGKVTVNRIFEKSSNVGTAKVIMEVYNGREKDFVDRIYNLGLTQPLNLGFAGEATPKIKYPSDKDWYGTTLAFMSHGYELEVTPLHMLTYYNAVANDGKMMKPMFVEEIKRNGQIKAEFKPSVLRSSICSEATLGKLQAMCEAVVEHGTAKALQSDKYNFAGKTGTAKISDPVHGFNHNKYRASFVGYFPVENPKYSCIVVISEPKGSFYGGSVAGPVFREIADCVYASDLELEFHEDVEQEDLLPIVKSGNAADTKHVIDQLGLKAQTIEAHADYIVANKNSTQIEFTSEKLKEFEMPNVVGMGAVDAMYLIEKAGLKAKLKGAGKVKKQSPKAGTTCREGQLVYLSLS